MSPLIYFTGNFCNANKDYMSLLTESKPSLGDGLYENGHPTVKPFSCHISQN